MIRHIILPGALPQILIGLRQCLGVAWPALVVAKQGNTSAGLGFIISQATQFLRKSPECGCHTGAAPVILEQVAVLRVEPSDCPVASSTRPLLPHPPRRYRRLRAGGAGLRGRPRA